MRISDFLKPFMAVVAPPESQAVSVGGITP